MNKQINFRATKFTEVQLNLLSEKLGVNKTQIIEWAINMMAINNGISSDEVFEEIPKLYNNIEKKLKNILIIILFN